MSNDLIVLNHNTRRSAGTEDHERSARCNSGGGTAAGTRCRTPNALSDDSRTQPPLERQPFKRLFFVSTHSHVASRGSRGGATVAMPMRSNAGTVLHARNALRAVCSCCLAIDGAARCSAAGERLIAGRRPTVFGRVAFAGAESDCVSEVLECSLTPWAP